MPLAVMAATEYWTFSTAESAIEAVMHQVGYGWLPEAWITAPLDEQVKTLLTLFRRASRGTPHTGSTA